MPDRRKTCRTSHSSPESGRTGALPWIGVVALIALLSAMGVPTAHADADVGLHLELERTEPAEDSVLSTPPSEVRLFFSEAPEPRGTSVRLADSAGELVSSTEAEADEEDRSQVFIRPLEELAPGSYTVHWRVIAQDGHAQNGEFGFRIEEAR